MILNFSKFKVFADNKISVAHLLLLNFVRVEGNFRSEENAGYQHCLLFHIRFKKTLFSVEGKLTNCFAKGEFKYRINIYVT